MAMVCVNYFFLLIASVILSVTKVLRGDSKEFEIMAYGSLACKQYVFNQNVSS